ncbi:peptidoglycan-binding protein [Streptomyces fulvoviolaceus]|uniref:peptidoglycan-binding protein n=1 Tax=Streptomyces fulvoviolaceus TaxID=285535 RepID=UPI0021C19106|nr:peptidoglycan-binding protein [Streptomyces fulvoviolaceus]MCT9074987.1 peptidoglycan-binding protein [Streptomyces fulvoviolaceus]
MTQVRGAAEADRGRETDPGRPTETEVARPGGPESGPSGMASRRRWVVAVALGAVLATLGGLGAALLVKSPAQVAAEAGAPSPDVLTAPVEHRVLTSSVITRGQVVAGQTVEVIPQVPAGEGAARAVITRIPVRAGDTVKAGRLLMEVSGRPVFTLQGSLPVYRDLRPGATGDDVRQLQRALRKLGHDTAPDTTGRFGSGTKAALNSFYATLGYEPVSAYDGEGDPVEDARGQVTAAERALEDTEDALASANTVTDSGRSTSEAGDEDTASQGKAVRRAREDLADARAKLTAAEAAAGPILPAAEVVFVQSFPARVGSVSAKVGGEASGTAMTLSAGRLVVQAYVPEYQKDLIRSGRRAEIYSEVSGTSARGEVTSVSDPPATSGEQGQNGEAGEAGTAQSQSAQGRLVQITPDKPLNAELTGQDVRVTVIAASTEGKALVVPITAISSGADGRTTVTVVEASGARRRVEVRAGTSGDGFVAVVPVAGSGGLIQGDQVVTGVPRASGDSIDSADSAEGTS